MNRLSPIIKYGLIVAPAILGIAISFLGRWELSDVRWSPLYEQKIPKPNASANFEFWSDSGVFEVEVKLPMSAAEISEVGGLAKKPPVSCSLGFRVRAGEHIVSNIDVSSLRWTGIVGYTHVNCFAGGAINIPKLGKYVLELTNAGGEFKSPAANFSLVRQQNAENAAFGYGISKLVSHALLGVSIVSAMFCWIRYLLKRKRGQT